MDAVIKISSSEFTDDFFQKMKQLLKGRNVQITIAVQDEADSFCRTNR
ncbi:hypothetical protein [Niabella ginsengisoli]|uniref:Uncharacterized protein n=1 Tax=Niabella ginsengisoli TaxID=522298 RepID=A0ABS9SIB7_9BACT|nr:hypothetical protein [Niabella ginsengisoli]MCH5598091.1 hypothetical protein [Niabella ginsengisoli]